MSEPKIVSAAVFLPKLFSFIESCELELCDDNPSPLMSYPVFAMVNDFHCLLSESDENVTEELISSFYSPSNSIWSGYVDDIRRDYDDDDAENPGLYEFCCCLETAEFYVRELFSTL